MPPPQGNNQDIEPVVLDFREDGADEVIHKAQTLVGWFDKLIDRMLGLGKAAKAARETVGGGGGSSPAGGSLLDTLRQQMADLTKSYEGRTPTVEEGRRRVDLYKQIRQLETAEKMKENQDARSRLREFAAGERARETEQKAHVSWVVRTLDSAGLGGLVRSAGAARGVAGSLASAIGMDSMAGLAKGIGGVVGFAGAGLITMGAMGTRRALGASPAHAMNMDIAGYINPFEANDSSRGASKILAAMKRFGNRSLMFAAEQVNYIGSGASLYYEGLLPWMNLQAAKANPSSTPESIARLQAELDKAMKKARKFTEEPTVGEVRWLQSITGSSVQDYKPQSDFARMGLYASRGEGEAVRGQIAVQTELIDVLKKNAHLLSELSKAWRDEQAGAGGKGLKR